MWKYNWISRGFRGTPSPNTIKLIGDINDFLDTSYFIPIELLNNVKVFLDENKSREEVVPLQELKEELKYLEKEKKKLQKKQEGQETLLKLSEKINRLKELISNAKGDNVVISIKLLGYYTRCGVSGGPEIVLLMDALKDDPILTAIVYVHELMHAYYDMHDTVHHYCPVIEEPIAEYGMLRFFDAFSKAFPSYIRVFKQALNHVERKKWYPGVCHYGYGHYLFADMPNCPVKWDELYHNTCTAISPTSKEVKDYMSMISPARYPRDERACEIQLYMALCHAAYSCVFGSGFGFTATTSWCSNGRLLFNTGMTLGRNFDFKFFYPPVTQVRMTFKDKHGTTLKGDASLISRHRFYIPVPLRTNYVTLFGNKKRTFRFSEIKYREWLAQEI